MRYEKAISVGQPNRSRPDRRGAVGTRFALAVLAVVALVGGGTIWWTISASGGGHQDALIDKAVKSDFILEVTEQGEIESANKQEIRCEVKSRNTSGTAILRIVPEGTNVQSGDFLVEFDSSALEDQRVQQQKMVNASYAAMIQAQNTHDVALISEKEYLEGTFKENKEMIESQIFVAKENLRRAQEYLEWSRRMVAKRYMPQLQLEADQFAVERNKKDLSAVKTQLDVLERFTRAKMLKTLESAIVTAKARWESDRASHGLEESKLKEIDEQIKKCVIYAPSAGQVKYAHRKNRHGGQDFVVEEGAMLRELQAVIRLPDPSRMQVKLKINESVVDMVRSGMPASIRLIGLKDVVLAGTVERVNQYSEPSSWRKANVKEYAAIVRIDHQDDRLRSGMTAEVTIVCQYIPNVMQVAVQTVHHHGPDYYCFVKTKDGYQARKVAIGATNDKHVVITDGLTEGEEVTLNPRRFLGEVELPKLTAEEAQQVVKSGKISPELAARASSAVPNGSRRSPGERPRGSGQAGGPGRSGSSADRTGSMFDRFDKNKDGKLAMDELPERMRSWLAQADTSGDGVIDRSELTAAMGNRGEGGRRRGSGAGG